MSTRSYPYRILFALFVTLVLSIGSQACVGAAPEGWAPEESGQDVDDPNGSSEIETPVDAGQKMPTDDGRSDAGFVPFSRDGGPGADPDAATDENGRAHDASSSDDVGSAAPIPEEELDDGRD